MEVLGCAGRFWGSMQSNQCIRWYGRSHVYKMLNYVYQILNHVYPLETGSRLARQQVSECSRVMLAEGGALRSISLSIASYNMC